MKERKKNKILWLRTKQVHKLFYLHKKNQIDGFFKKEQ